MHGFGGEDDGVAYDGVAKVSSRGDADIPATWNSGGEGSYYRAEIQETLLRTKGANSTKRIHHPSPLPSPCHSELGRRLEQGESTIDCHSPPIAKQVLMV
jgi:hypothetical protein